MPTSHVSSAYLVFHQALSRKTREVSRQNAPLHHLQLFSPGSRLLQARYPRVSRHAVCHPMGLQSYLPDAVFGVIQRCEENRCKAANVDAGQTKAE